MKLRKLFKDLAVEIKGLKDLEITGISNNSKRIVPGHLFIARKGQKFNGSEYIEEAIHNGATAVLCGHFNPFLKQVTQILYPDPQSLEAELAARFYDHPSEQLEIIAITGTNGKTTVSSLIQQLLQHLHHNDPAICGMIGTVGYDTGRGRYHADHTTPDSLTLQKMLREMVGNGCKYCAMEATSHGLVQGRTDCLRIGVGVFTNLTHDHLDYHGSMEKYAEAKSLLFNSERTGKFMHTAVVNCDDPYHEIMVKNFRGKILRYGLSPSADLLLTKANLHASGSDLKISYQGHTWQTNIALVGSHNLMNCLAAIGALLSHGFAMEKILEKLHCVKNVRGRLERVGTPKGAVYVDFAHTPDALERAILTLRQVHPKSRITCVFGCGGDRDPTKRPIMGKIAQAHCDRVIVTSDNPRSEQPEKIIQQITAGMTPSEFLTVEPDRALAIAKALEDIQDSDVVIIAGKGHENYQIVGSRVIAFDDAQTVREWFHAQESSCIS